MPHKVATRKNWFRVAVWLWTAALIVVCLRSVLSVGSNSVWTVFAEAGRDWLSARDLYDYRIGELSGPYRYSPLVAALLAPLSLLPEATGGVVWRLLCGGVLLGGLWLWSRCLASEKANSVSMAGVFLLALPLTIGNLNNGQSNPLVLGLILVGTAFLIRDGESRRRGFAILAAVALALPVLIKGYPIAAALLLAVVVPWRFAGWLAMAVIVEAALPFALQRPDYVAEQYAGWWHHLTNDERGNLPLSLWYRDVRLLLANLGIPLSATAYAMIQLTMAAAMAGVCLGLRRHGWPAARLLMLAMGLACCWMTVFGSATESATYVLLGPTAAATLLTSWQRPATWWSRGLALSGYLLLIVSQMAVWFPQGRAIHTLGLQPLAGLLVLGGLLGVAWADLRQTSWAGADKTVPAPLQ